MNVNIKPENRDAPTIERLRTGSRLWFENLNISARLSRVIWDTAGVLLIAVAFMTLLAMFYPSKNGVLLTWWIHVLRLWFGWGTVWISLVFLAIGIWVLLYKGRSKQFQIKWGRVLAFEIAALSSIALLSLLGGFSLQHAESGLDGGRIGWGLVKMLHIAFGMVGISSEFWSQILLVLLLFSGVYVGLGVSRVWGKFNLNDPESAQITGATGRADFPAVSEAPISGIERSRPKIKSEKKRRSALPPEFRKRFTFERQVEGEKPLARNRDERLPDLDLLVKERSTRPDERNINMTAGLIEKTLSEFGIPVKVVGFQVGPTVTQFAVEPGYLEKEKIGIPEREAERQKIRVGQISGLKKDLALALSAERLRIEAPVPGRPYVGIEVPNPKVSTVRLQPILESDAFYALGSQLTIALGRDVSGQPIVADLGSMPHLLIAGTTGSGKSVCIAALTTCLVMNNTPEDLRLVMIDPKMVELVRFNGLPHLYGQVETDLDRILGVLRWVVVEMDRRYKLLESSRSRNIDSFNRKMRRKKDGKTLPRLVVMIDELADLMMSAPDQTEHNLVRLAQMARATGIHLVIATQRPSTDVVTGLIKANFPARASFAVASSVDSRVILDAAGAESLLGQGDMLFLPPEAPAPIRTQGVMVDDKEIEKVIEFWQTADPQVEIEKPPWDSMLREEAELESTDRLLNRAIEIVRSSNKASTSMLQRRLHIGYPRAARLIEDMEMMGVVGPPVSGGREREVLAEDGS